MARPVQVAVAREMISPSSKQNISLQLNMGEGKSSVIIPLVASTLANGSNLVRIVTPRPLSNQMFQLLVSRLGGLADRPIFYVPISRHLSLKDLGRMVEKIWGLYEDCVSKGGVLVVQPGHILSLKLMDIDILLRSYRNNQEGSIIGDRMSSHDWVSTPSFDNFDQSDENLPVTLDVSDRGDEYLPITLDGIGKGDKKCLTAFRDDSNHWAVYELERLQDWLAEVSRDVLDESDEILHPRYKLVYAAGEQIPVDGHPDRWTTIQHIFTQLQVHAVKLQASFPDMLEIDLTLRGFPTIRILDSAIFRKISSLIIDDALAGALPNLTLDVLPSPILAASRRFMAQTEVSDVDRTLIHSYCAGTALFNGILLLRGLLMECYGILGYILKERRWRVDYGLDPRRTLLAVPYHAKVCCIFRIAKDR